MGCLDIRGFCWSASCSCVVRGGYNPIGSPNRHGLGQLLFLYKFTPHVDSDVASVETPIVGAGPFSSSSVSLLLTGLATSRDSNSQHAPNRN